MITTINENTYPLEIPSAPLWSLLPAALCPLPPPTPVCFLSLYMNAHFLGFYLNAIIQSEKAMAPHSSTLAWKIPWTEEPGRLQFTGSLRVGDDLATSLHFSLSCIGEGNGNPLQCSFLENPRDRGAWWAAISGVTQSQTRLKRLSYSGRSAATLAESNAVEKMHLKIFLC